MMCNDHADQLYAVAFLVLDTAADAEEAVKNAFEDGFKGVDRINDGNHLCAWLSRELTKYIVAKLKEYRAENRTVSGGDIPEKTAFCRLNDLDRLVCALSLAFGYKTKEITIITGACGANLFIPIPIVVAAAFFAASPLHTVIW